MKKEIGGYIELDTYNRPMLYEEGVKLNCGRNALAYLIEAKNIKKILMPKFMCDACDKVLEERGVKVRRFSVGLDLKPKKIDREDEEWLYIVNYYGQLSNNYIKSLGQKIIVDNAQAYFQEPIEGFDTIYTCRKFFGVSDGAILFTDVVMDVQEIDKSYDRMRFLLGRYERTALEFYQDYVSNNGLLDNEPIKRMSKLTYNFLHAIDYERICSVRTNNFDYLNEKLKDINLLKLNRTKGAYMYPLLINNGSDIRKKLQQEKIYIPILWPNVLKKCQINELEYDLTNNILPLPIDQRYDVRDMDYVVDKVLELI